MTTKGLNRKLNEKFYTKINIVEKIIKTTLNYIDISYENDLIIEPSAGNGSFLNAIEKIVKNKIYLDIEPEHEKIIKQDFLTFEQELNINGKIHIIGNPPFGRQSSFAKKFIKKSCQFADTIIFILPKSFKKQSFKKTFNEYYHLLYEEDVEDNGFLLNGNEYNVPCIFQIWKKEQSKRLVEEKKNELNFNFVKKQDNPDISFRRVGVYAGKISEEINDKNEQTHYFVKFNFNNIKLSKQDLICKLKQLYFEHNNTVAAKSISKQELITEFNKWTT